MVYSERVMVLSLELAFESTHGVLHGNQICVNYYVQMAADVILASAECKREVLETAKLGDEQDDQTRSLKTGVFCICCLV